MSACVGGLRGRSPDLLSSMRSLISCSETKPRSSDCKTHSLISVSSAAQEKPPHSFASSSMLISNVQLVFPAYSLRISAREARSGRPICIFLSILPGRTSAAGSSA